MNEKECGREPANGAAHLNEYPEIREEAGRVQLNADGSVTMASLDELSTWVLDIAATCGSEVAEKACVDDPCGARAFVQPLSPVGFIYVFSLFAQHRMAAGPDEVRRPAP